MIQELLLKLKEKEDELQIVRAIKIEKNESEIRAWILNLQSVLEQTKEQLLKADEEVPHEASS